MSKTTKTPSVPAPQFVIFDPPIPGYESKAEFRKAKTGERYWVVGGSPQKATSNTETHQIVLTPVKRIEDLLPQNLKCEMWAGQDEDGSIVWDMSKLHASEKGWEGDDVRFVAMKEFNPFCLPVEHNADWKSQLYHFTPAQGWKKVGGK